MSGTVCEAFGVLAELGIALDAAPLTKHAGCWECQIDKQWLIAVNGHKQPMRWRDITVDPFHCYVEYNGWPAGIFTPYGGTIAAGEGANEDTFIAAMQTRLADAARTLPESAQSKSGDASMDRGADSGCTNLDSDCGLCGRGRHDERHRRDEMTEEQGLSASRKAFDAWWYDYRIKRGLPDSSHKRFLAGEAWIEGAAWGAAARQRFDVGFRVACSINHSDKYIQGWEDGQDAYAAAIESQQMPEVKA